MRRYLLIAMLAIWVASCSGSSSKASTAGSSSSTGGTARTTTTSGRSTTSAAGTTSTSRSTSSSSTAPESGDAAIAARAALTAHDLPSFTAAPTPAPTAAQTAAARQFAACVGVGTGLVDADAAPGEVRRVFVDGNIHIANTVHVFPSRADVAPRFAAYTSAETPSCLGAYFKVVVAPEAAQQHFQIGTVTVAKLPVAIKAEQSAHFRITAPLTTPQEQVNLYVDLLVAIQGRAAVTLTTDSGQQFEPTEEAALIDKVVGRLPATI